jgi:hypothetical protein
MSISTGDSRHSAPKKSTTAAGGASPDTAPADEPVGGVLPVKKTSRPAAGAKANGAGRTSATATKTAPKAATKSTQAKAGSATKAGAATKGTGGKPKVQSALVGGKGASALTGGKGGGRRPITPVRVAQTRNWGPILLYVATGVVAIAIIGIGVWPVIQENMKGTWREQAAAIPGILNYMDPESDVYDAMYTQRASHPSGDLTYPVSPAVGGNHNIRWQRCMGDVYTAEIAEEHAVHSLEHGAVWVTYSPDLPQDQIDKLADKVEGRDYTMMSPYPGLDAKVSLQAWGYQLKVDSVDDPRIDEFINVLRHNATQEEGATCGGGITDTSPTPIEF